MPERIPQGGRHPTTALLHGWTIPLRRFISGRPGYFHHTYVTSDLGDKWGCAGRDRGGQVVCQGQADLDVVRCIAGTGGRADILYGFTGVCHQIANRILYPAGGRTVRASQGYALTVGVFGEYGIGPWPRLTACYGLGATIGAAFDTGDGSGTAAGSQHSSSQDAQGLRIERSIMLDGDFKDRAHSLRRLILDQRDAAVPDETAQIVIDQHRGFWGYQNDLIGMLLAEQIDKAQYLERFNDGLSALMTADRQVLGDQAYAAIFGPEFDAADSVIDAETFLAEEPSDELETQAGSSRW